MLSQQAKREVFRRYGGACAICGATNLPLEVCHVVPRKAGGPDDIENLAVLCPNHLRQLNKWDMETFHELKFVGYLAELLRLSPDFDDVATDPVLPGRNRLLRPDLFAREHTRKASREVYVECKPDPVLTEKRIDDVIAQLARYRDASPDSSMVLALPGTLPATAAEQLRHEGIELWDQPYLSQRFSQEIPQTHQLWFRHVLGKKHPRGTTEEERLRNELRKCASGRSGWPIYQKLIGKIIESLFCPPLATPLTERSDSFGINRRDHILPNYAEEGFWSFLRLHYQADFVVVDAKNYTRKVKKKDALQIANYLKPRGAGLFGLIFSRNGLDRGCDLTLREL